MSHEAPEPPEPLPEPPLPLGLPPLPGEPPDPVEPPEPVILAPPLPRVLGLFEHPAPVIVQPAATAPSRLRATTWFFFMDSPFMMRRRIPPTGPWAREA